MAQPRGVTIAWLIGELDDVVRQDRVNLVRHNFEQVFEELSCGSTLGSVIEVADIERIEVLKGPQDTLFGRNSTDGAISIVTRDPSGKLGIHQGITLANRAQLRLKTRMDSQQFGPLGLSATYAHSETRGDIRNTGAGST